MNNKMKSYVGYIAATAALAMLVASCSVVNQAIKSGDPDYAYHQALELYEQGKWDSASTLFEACRHIYMGSPREDSLSFYNARCKFKSHDWDEAVMQLDEYRRKFGRSPFIEDAEGMYADCFYRMSPGSSRDQTMTSKAIIAINEFIARYPESDKVEEFKKINDELTERLHEKTYLNAYTYYKIGRFKSAIVALKNALRTYPESKYREEIMYLIVDSGYRLAENSIAAKQTDRYLSMLDSYLSFCEEFPESEHRKQVDKWAENARDFLARNGEGQTTEE